MDLLNLIERMDAMDMTGSLYGKMGKKFDISALKELCEFAHVDVDDLFGDDPAKEKAAVAKLDKALKFVQKYKSR